MVHDRWAESGELVAISSDTSFYILKYNREMVDAYLASGEPVDENEGIEDAFELLYEIGERVRTVRSGRERHPVVWRQWPSASLSRGSST